MAATINHKDSPRGNRHPPWRQVFADASERTGDAETYTTADLYSLAVQLDTGALYVLTSISPTTWTALEDVKEGLFVPKGSGQQVIYARSSGDDSTGDGSSGSPYATIARALQDVPAVYYGTEYVIDCTGVTESISEQLVLPPIVAPGRSALDVGLAGQYNEWKAPFVMRADPTVIEAAFTPDAVTADSVTGLKSIQKIGAGWTVDEHVGRLVWGDGFFEFGVVASNTADTLEVASRSVFGGTVELVEPSATIELTDSGSTKAAVYIQAMTDLVFSGIAFRHANTTDFAASVWCAGAGQAVFNLCTFEGLYAETTVLADGCYFGPRSGNTKELYNSGGELRGRYCLFLDQEFRQYGSAGTGNSGHFGSIIDDCTSVGHGGNNEPEQQFEINYCEIRNGKGAGVVYHGGGRSSVRDCRISDCVTTGVSCAAPGLLQLQNVRGSGNGTYGCGISTGGHVEATGTTDVTGASGDVNLGGAGATAWGAAPANDLGAATPQGCFLH